MSAQGSLEFTGKRNKFDGAAYEPKHDDVRLTGQILRVYECMKDGKWRTLTEVRADMCLMFCMLDGEASISAQIRNLRKDRWGAHVVERRPRGDRERGLWEYKLVVQP